MEQEKKINAEVELERAKLSNYILKKENEILLGTIGILSRDKEALITELEAIKNSKTFKIKAKFDKIMRRK